MGSEPLCQRVQLDLASQISDGFWRPGQFLPSGQALQDRYRVSRTTIRKAVPNLWRPSLGLGTLWRRWQRNWVHKVRVCGCFRTR